MSENIIIVDKYEKMDKIVKWYDNNKDCFKNEQFKLPFNHAIILWEYESLKFNYSEISEGIINCKLYATINDKNTLIATLIYDYINNNIKDLKINADGENKVLLAHTLAVDNTIGKVIHKFLSLMYYAVYYYDNIEISRRISKSKSIISKKKKKNNSSRRLIRKVYIVKEEYSEIPNVYKDDKRKRKYTKPDTEVFVRGYYRRTSHGTIWVKPYVKYRGKNNSEDNKYIV